MAADPNAVTIYKYLVQHGYSPMAAGGILVCIWGESGFNPEAIQAGQPASSTGGGLIQWTPIDAHPNYVTGNASRDMQTQLQAILDYNNAKGPALLQQLNSQSTLTGAAQFYSLHYEMPLVQFSDLHPAGYTAAQEAMAAAGSVVQGVLGTGTGGSTGTTGGGGAGGTSAPPQTAFGDLGIDTILGAAGTLLRDVATVLDYVFGMFGRGQGWRMIFTMVTGISAFLAYKCLSAAGAVPEMHMPSMMVI